MLRNCGNCVCQTLGVRICAPRASEAVRPSNEKSHRPSSDSSPLYRSTVGFDRLFSLLDQHSSVASAAPTYPPYNIERTGENAYRITIVVAGFADNELSIETRENTLTVRGSKETAQKSASENRETLYQGIAARAFERRFQLADHVSASGRRPRTACFTSISFARSPKRRNRAASRSTSRPGRLSRPSSRSPNRRPDR